MLRPAFPPHLWTMVSWVLLGLTIPLGVRSFIVPQSQPLALISVGSDPRSCPQKSPFDYDSRSIGPNWQESQDGTQATLITLKANLQDDQEEEPKLSKRGAIAKCFRTILRRIRKPLFPIAGSLMFWWSARTAPAEAKMSHEATKTPTYSLRPGMSTSDIEDVLAGKADIKDHDPSSVAATTAPSPKPKESTSSKSIYGADFEDEDDFDLDDDQEEAFASRRVATQADQLRAQSMQASESSQFSSYGKGKTNMMVFKVSVGLFLPTFGTMFVREHFRQRKEEAYVQKGLEILEAQKAEYFNVTSTSEDSDLEDELKGLKNNSTDADEDDDDDNDEDEDDEEDDRRRGPKRPRGGGDDDHGDSGSGGGVGFDPGYGEASDEDRDRLKNLFNKS